MADAGPLQNHYWLNWGRLGLILEHFGHLTTTSRPIRNHHQTSSGSTLGFGRAERQLLTHLYTLNDATLSRTTFSRFRVQDGTLRRVLLQISEIRCSLVLFLNIKLKSFAMYRFGEVWGQCKSMEACMRDHCNSSTKQCTTLNIKTNIWNIMKNNYHYDQAN